MKLEIFLSNNIHNIVQFPDFNPESSPGTTITGEESTICRTRLRAMMKVLLHLPSFFHSFALTRFLPWNGASRWLQQSGNVVGVEVVAGNSPTLRAKVAFVINAKSSESFDSCQSRVTVKSRLLPTSCLDYVPTLYILPAIATNGRSERVTSWRRRRTQWVFVIESPIHGRPSERGASDRHAS